MSFSHVHIPDFQLITVPLTSRKAHSSSTNFEMSDPWTVIKLKLV